MKNPHLQLTENERTSLERLVSQGKGSVRVLKRALALLALNQGASLQSVAQHQQMSYATVSNLRDKYKRSGLQCLYDQSRSGRPAKIDGTQRAKITALACSAAPKDMSAGHCACWPTKSSSWAIVRASRIPK